MSGVASGLAVNTKYSGILALIIVAVYAVAVVPEIFRSRVFVFSLFIPLGMLLPWLAWNISVYGADIFSSALLVHGNFNLRLMLPFLFVSLVIMGYVFYINWRGEAPDADSLEPAAGEVAFVDRARRVAVASLGAALFFVLFKNMVNGLDIRSTPFTSWQGGHFTGPLFYLGRLIEFSFINTFALAAFFWGREKEDKEMALLYMTAAGIILFFMIWGGYQTRYILAAVPVMLILGLRVLGKIYSFLARAGNRFVNYAGRTAFVVFVCYLFLKINYLNFLVSYPNNMCYF